MKKISTLAIVGVIINTLITLYITFSSELRGFGGLSVILLVALFLCFVGILLIVLDKVKIGSIIFYIGSILFVPIGLIGMIGVKKTVEKLKDEKFNKENYE